MVIVRTYFSFIVPLQFGWIFCLVHSPCLPDPYLAKGCARWKLRGDSAAHCSSWVSGLTCFSRDSGLDHDLICTHWSLVHFYWLVESAGAPCLPHRQDFPLCPERDPGASQVAPHLSLANMASCRNPFKFGNFLHIVYNINGIWEAERVQYGSSIFTLESSQSVCWFSYASYILKSQQNENYNT